MVSCDGLKLNSKEINTWSTHTCTQLLMTKQNSFIHSSTHHSYTLDAAMRARLKYINHNCDNNYDTLIQYRYRFANINNWSCWVFAHCTLGASFKLVDIDDIGDMASVSIRLYQHFLKLQIFTFNYLTFKSLST